MSDNSTPGFLRILQVDAFTRRPFEGNAAAVVLDPGTLSDAGMLRIAREMNLSETAFLLPPSSTAADLRIRWFTPAAEVDLCGHATVATFHAALEEGRLAPGVFRMECRVGVLPVALEREPDGGALVKMGLPLPALHDLHVATCRVAEVLGIETDDLDNRLPVQRTGEWMLVPAAGLPVVRRLRPDFKAMRDLMSELGLGSAIVMTTETVDPGSAVHLRMFAPGFGIDEDPVTGSAQGPVAAYLMAHRLIAGADFAQDRVIYTAEQGDCIGRRGRINVEVTLSDGAITSITIMGRAVTVMTGMIRLPTSM